MITREDIQKITDNSIAVCRRDIDQELIKLAKMNMDSAWSDERAHDIAQQAADIAVKQITDGFYASVGRKTVMIIGGTIVAMVFIMREVVEKWVGMK